MMTQEHKDFLDALRESGQTNMWGATSWLVDEFDLAERDAKIIQIEWMRSFANEIQKTS